MMILIKDIQKQIKEQMTITEQSFGIIEPEKVIRINIMKEMLTQMIRSEKKYKASSDKIKRRLTQMVSPENKHKSSSDKTKRQ